jgi:integrase
MGKHAATITDKTLKAVVARAKANHRRIEVAVGGAISPGLRIRVMPDGVAMFQLRYRINRIRRTITLETQYPALGLGEARETAQKLLAQVTLGSDPWQAKRDEREAERQKKLASMRTMSALILPSTAQPERAWLSSDASKAWRPRTRAEFTRIMVRNVLPVFGDRDPNGITRDEINKLLQDIRRGRGAIGYGDTARVRTEPAPREANHTLSVVRLFFNWCAHIDQKELGVTNQPCAGLEPTEEATRANVYTAEQIRAVLAATVNTELSELVPLILHTATRDEETRSMRWQDLDLERSIWTIPAEVSKSGKAHVVALSSGAKATIETIRARKVQTFSPFVFPAPTKTGHMDRPQKALMAASRSLGFALRLHDIRRTVSDRLRSKFGEAIMHAVLGHTDPTLTRTYGPTPREEAIVEATQWWSDELEKICAHGKIEAAR